MKLVGTVKYLFSKRNSNLFLILILISGILPPLNAQTYKFEFVNNESVAEALEHISEQLHIKVAFDAGMLKGINAHNLITGNTSDEIIGNLLENSNYWFRFKNNRYLIIPLSEKDKEISECSIQGKIVDSETNELLPLASIYVVNQNISTTTSEGGTFSLKGITVNPIHLKISYIGFQAIDTLIYRSNSLFNCNFKLSRKIQLMDSVIVRGSKVEMVDLRNDVDFATTLNPSKITDLPVVVETDIFKTLQLLPGISYTSNTSELSIRGGTSDQNLILFDGQTLYNLSHYYGVISNLNPNVIKDIQIYKGGYDSRYGERVSGIVDIKSKSGNQINPVVYGDINLVCANITAELPIGNKLSLVAAYRRSYSDIYNTSLSNKVEDNKPHTFRGDSNNLIYQTTPSFYFYDFNTKLTYHISDKENISLGILGSKDFFDNSYNGATSKLKINTTDKNNWGNYSYSASWQRQWNESFFSNVQAGTSGYENEYINKTNVIKEQTNNRPHPNLPDNINNFNVNETNELTDISFSMRNTYYINNNNHINFGVLARKNTLYYHHDAEKVYVYDDVNESSWITSLYMQNKIQTGSKFTFKPGIRVNYYNKNQNIYFEPRLAANYRFSDFFSVRMATGRYYQFISKALSQQETGYNKSFWVLANDSTHPVLSSNHFVIGTTIEKGRFLFDAETYIKSFNGLQEYIFLNPYFAKNPDFPNMFPKGNRNSTKISNFMAAPPPPDNQSPPSFFINGTGRSIGIDFFIRYKSKKYTSWVSYSLSKSTQQFMEINNNKLLYSPADQTHQLSLTNLLNLGKWNFSTTTLFSTGRPYVDSTANSRGEEITRYFKRLPNYFRCDASINYNFYFAKLRLKMGATVVNILNTKNFFDVSTRKFDFENNSFAETNLIRSQDLSLNLFLHFAL